MQYIFLQKSIKVLKTISDEWLYAICWSSFLLGIFIIKKRVLFILISFGTLECDCVIKTRDITAQKMQARNEITCPQIVNAYNKSMGGVDLADRLIFLYRLEVETRRRYIKMFWHLVDIAKVNAWILYCHNYKQYGLPGDKNKSLLIFSLEINEGLIHANKAKTPNSSAGRVSERNSVK